MVKDPDPAPRHHREALDRWLQARASGEDANDLPHGRELYRAVGDLQKFRPHSYDVLHRLYLSPNPDPSLAQRWETTVRTEGPTPSGRDAMFALRLLQSARAFILYTLYLDAERDARRVRREASGAGTCPDCGQPLPKTSPQSSEVRF